MGELCYEETSAVCSSCGEHYPIKKGKIYFIEAPKRDDDLDSVKGKLKRLLGKYYYTIGIQIIAPVYPFNFAKHIHQHLDTSQALVVNIGCGNHRFDENIIGLDIYDYDAVDVVCDLTRLPFKPDCVDAFISNSVIEHLPHPEVIVDNLFQSTKPGGKGIHLIPFMFPFHASPYDFQRYTHKGLEVLFDKWETEEVTNVTGPVSLFLLNLIEFLSIILAFGSGRMKALVYLLLCGLLFPLKFLDILFVNNKSFLTLAPTLFIVLGKEK